MNEEICVFCDGLSEESLRIAERQKARLENAGYTLVREAAGLFWSRLYYRLNNEDKK